MPLCFYYVPGSEEDEVPTLELELLLVEFINGGMALSASVDIPVGETGAVTFSLVKALAEVTF